MKMALDFLDLVQGVGTAELQTPPASCAILIARFSTSLSIEPYCAFVMHTVILIHVHVRDLIPTFTTSQQQNRLEKSYILYVGTDVQGISGYF